MEDSTAGSDWDPLWSPACLLGSFWIFLDSSWAPVSSSWIFLGPLLDPLFTFFLVPCGLNLDFLILIFLGIFMVYLHFSWLPFRSLWIPFGFILVFFWVPLQFFFLNSFSGPFGLF